MAGAADFGNVTGLVTTARRDDALAAAAAISAGHADYPSFRYLFPDRRRRASALAPFFDATVRDAVGFGSVLCIRSGVRVDATAVWLPPGAFPWSLTRKLRVLPAMVRVCAAYPGAFRRFVQYGSRVEAHHRDADPSWYLVVLSVRPERQRRGLGGRLMAPILEKADREGVTCRLETADPKNVGYYQRFGFEVVGEPLEVLSGGPRLVSMRRLAPRHS